MAETHEYIVQTPDNTEISLTTQHHHTAFDSVKDWYEHHKPLVRKALISAGSLAMHEHLNVNIWKKGSGGMTRIK